MSMLRWPPAGRPRPLSAAAVLSIIIALLAPASTAARDPWEPYPAASDRVERVRQPAGWVDVRAPVKIRLAGPPPIATTTRTSIVLLVLDDLPAMDTRVLMRLPTLRTLFLREGLQFTRAHANDPLCCPGRAALLTGLTTDHHGVYTNDARLLDSSVTIATELDGAGYYTFTTGKYLNQSLSVRIPPGWDKSATTNGAYYHYAERLNGVFQHHDDDPEDYQPDVTFSRAVGFLRKAPPDQPVFAWISPFTVHQALDPHRPEMPPEAPVAAPRFWDDARCDGLDPWITPAHADDNADRPVHQQGWDRFRDGYPLEPVCESLLAVDAGMRRIVTELTAQGRLRDTLFVLISDNGMGWGMHGQYGKPASFTTHIPLFVHWEAGRGLEPGVDETFVSNVDIAPTLCAVAGCRMGPYSDGRARSDGVNLLPRIEADGSIIVRQALYTEDLTGVLWRAIRTTPDSSLGLWHYAEYSTGERELYDARGGLCWEWDGGVGDPCELTNLAGVPDHAVVEAALHDLLASAVASGGARLAFSGRIVERSR